MGQTVWLLHFQTFSACVFCLTIKSCMTPALDALIPIRHQGPINDYNVRVRDYVPPEHKRFLEYLDVSPSLRELLVEYKSDSIIDKFNSFIDAYAEQRSKHIQVNKQFFIFCDVINLDCNVIHRSSCIKAWRRFSISIGYWFRIIAQFNVNNEFSHFKQFACFCWICFISNLISC